MKQKVPFKLPVRKYSFGHVYQVRDVQNRIVIQLNLMRAGLDYYKECDTVLDMLCGFFNGKMAVVDGEVLDNVEIVNLDEEKPGIVEAIKTSVVETVTKKKPGRPSKK